MKKGDFIFVYGTLRRGERADLTKQFYAYGVDFVTKDKINGRLYHLGSFPGLKVDKSVEFQANKPIVFGEVFRIRDLSICAILDAYEGYQPDSPTMGLYNRSKVETEEGRTVWAYTYNHPVIEDQRIEGGDWCKNRETLNTRQLRA
jgi:gamma-glutamylcyclotransferase (GGCT)/AIG2-like uncharacterized protein YtfP